MLIKEFYFINHKVIMVNDEAPPLDNVSSGVSTYSDLHRYENIVLWNFVE
jgi:hypothetical protein